MIDLIEKISRNFFGRAQMPPNSRATAIALVALVIGLTPMTLFDSRASESMTNPIESAYPYESILASENADYSKFKHDNPNHARLPCLLCHRRETNSAQPALPGSNEHLPCAGCHAQQFADSSSPMCTICHTDVQSGKLKAFPRLSTFNMKFDHARHTGTGNLTCASCHKPSRGGVALSIPAGFSAHTACFRCHTPTAKSDEQNISSCGVCHQPGRHVRARETAAAFRVGFSHANHNNSAGLSCNECHRVRAGVAPRRQVSAPQPLNHHASAGAFSCMSCHNGKRAFGGDDFSACARCHTGSAWHF